MGATLMVDWLGRGGVAQTTEAPAVADRPPPAGPVRTAPRRGWLNVEIVPHPVPLGLITRPGVRTGAVAEGTEAVAVHLKPVSSRLSSPDRRRPFFLIDWLPRAAP